MVFGHDDKKDLFLKLIKNSSLHHAYLFYGDEGVGKMLFARHLAYCLERKEFNLGPESLLDLNVYQPDEKGIIGIDEIREIKSKISQKPIRSSRRTIIIDQAEKLTPAAQNALLKILEEPPSFGLLVLIAVQPEVLLPPLYSRLVKIYFPRFSQKAIARILVQKLKLDKKTAEKIAPAAFGSLGRALQLSRPPKKDKTEFDLSRHLDDLILKFYFQDKIRNQPKISFLLKRMTEVKRYNLNPKVQKKAVDYAVSKL